MRRRLAWRMWRFLLLLGAVLLRRLGMCGLVLRLVRLTILGQLARRPRLCRGGMLAVKAASCQIILGVR